MNIPPETMPALTLPALLEAVMEIVLAAGREVMAVYHGDFHVGAKDDSSPVTEADLRAEALIVPALQVLLPGVPVVAEEAVAAGHLPEAAPCFWLVDPLDGTREFVSRNGEFTVNVALVRDGRPVLGVVQAPALDQLYAGASGLGAFIQSGADAGTRRAIACRTPPAEGLTARTATRRRSTPSWPGGQSRGGAASAPRSSCASWQRARPISTRASGVRWSGISRQVRRCSKPLAARYWIIRGERCATASRAFRTRISWPGAWETTRRTEHEETLP